MTNANFHLDRRLLGLPVEWLAQKLDVNERTVRRWDTGVTDAPPGVMAFMEGLTTEAFDRLEDMVESLPQGAMVAVPRRDEDVQSDLDYPATWHLALAARLRDERTDLTFDYL